MSQESHLTCIDGDISLPRKYSVHVSEYVYNIIDKMKDGMSHTVVLEHRYCNEFPLFMSTSGF